MQEMKEELLRLGVELSLYVAQSMFVLCDDVRTVLRFCYTIWIDAKVGAVNESHVIDRLLRVMHYVYTNYIKPKNGVVYDQNDDGNDSVQWELIRVCFGGGFDFLSHVVYSLKSGETCRDRELANLVEQGVKNIEEMIGSVKGVSEANGFVWDDMESIILDMWKSLFDEEAEAKEATLTLNSIKNGIIRDLFLPLSNEVALPDY
ncbi:hypothetical protein EUTSA_v10014714mg [Eutrema salsugineum]|uniref:Uncharacterized protein n=1 Tax=Eutrema salsugineum TaxID=72664 RepID=V4KVX6_EUTSA|nr:hypothetical protein EUTSA_v10014714mg [Eutrema salsugineum]